jgi:hypothetical protein
MKTVTVNRRRILRLLYEGWVIRGSSYLAVVNRDLAFPVRRGAVDQFNEMKFLDSGKPSPKERFDLHGRWGMSAKDYRLSDHGKSVVEQAIRNGEMPEAPVVKQGWVVEEDKEPRAFKKVHLIAVPYFVEETKSDGTVIYQLLKEMFYSHRTFARVPNRILEKDAERLPFSMTKEAAIKRFEDRLRENIAGIETELMGHQRMLAELVEIKGDEKRGNV